MSVYTFGCGAVEPIRITSLGKSYQQPPSLAPQYPSRGQSTCNLCDIDDHFPHFTSLTCLISGPFYSGQRRARLAEVYFASVALVFLPP
jgi:hypothetical protein